MKCKHCERELKMVVIPIGEGLQVSCICECDATWIYDLYSLAPMTQVEGPTGLDQAIFDGVELYDDSTTDNWAPACPVV